MIIAIIGAYLLGLVSLAVTQHLHDKDRESIEDLKNKLDWEIGRTNGELKIIKDESVVAKYNDKILKLKKLTKASDYRVIYLPNHPTSICFYKDGHLLLQLRLNQIDSKLREYENICCKGRK